MSGSAVRGIVSISIDADSNSSSLSTDDRFNSVLVELLDRFHKHRIAGTWAFCDPAGTALARRRIAGEMPHQEVALLAVGMPSGSDHSRGETIRTVVRQVQTAAAAGIAISSLAITRAWQPQHVDLLTKHGITMVRAESAPAGSPRGNSRQGIARLDGIGVPAVCYGLWQVPVSATLRGGNWMANLVQVARLRRIVNRTAAHGGMCHVQIDAASLVLGDVSQGLYTIDRFLRNVRRLHDAGRINVETLRDTARRLLPKRTLAAHSILRAA